MKDNIEIKRVSGRELKYRLYSSNGLFRVRKYDYCYSVVCAILAMGVFWVSQYKGQTFDESIAMAGLFQFVYWCVFLPVWLISNYRHYKKYDFYENHIKNL